MTGVRAPSPNSVRVIDTGIRTGRENVAFDQALIEARNAGRIADTIRFLRFRPAALVGLHQVLSHEVRLAYCARHGIEVGRRITGGGGLYLDENQVCWELALDRRALPGDLASVAARICAAAAAGLRRLGVPAEFRPRNDIEVHGRKLCGTGGVVDGATLFFQGTLLADFDAERMIEALRVPAEKLARRDLDDARRRVVTLRELLGGVPPVGEIQAALLAGFAEHLKLEPRAGEVTDYEERLARTLHDEQYGTDEFVRSLDAPAEGDDPVSPDLLSATLVRKGGAIRADLRLERGHVREALVTGDFFVSPSRVRFDLEAALRGVAAAEAGAAVEAFFARTPCELVGLSPLDFREAVESALSQITLTGNGRRLRGFRRGPRDGTALVFLHDALGSVRLWRDFPDQLVRATGCGALVYDRWGSGESEPLSRPYSPDYLLDEAFHSLPEVLSKMNDVILVGQSDGASIALAYAGEFPARVRGMIALSPHLFVEAKTLAAIGRQIDDYQRGDLKARLRRHHGDRTEALFGRLVEVWTAKPAGAGWGLEPHVAKVRCPVLAIQGEDDEFFSVAQLEALARLVPHVQVLRIPGAAHYPMHQARSEVLAAAIAAIRSWKGASTGTSSPAPSPPR